MTDQSVPVMVVDDQLAFRKAAIALVAATEGFEVVGEADTGEAASTRPPGRGRFWC